MNATLRDPAARERAEALVQVGLQQEWRGQFREAEASYRRAICADRGFAAPRFLLGLLLVGRGDFERGLPLGEARLERMGFGSGGWMPPRWRGESLRGRSILVMFEQGFGDQIFYARFIPQLKERGASRVCVMVPHALSRIFERVSGVDEVVPVDAHTVGEHVNYQPRRSIDPTDYWTPLISLPYIRKTRVNTIPLPPYISADPVDIGRWRDRLPHGLRVGIVWRGDPKNVRNRCRSLPSLATLAPLWRVPGVNFISLQKGEGEDEARCGLPGLRLTHLGSDVRDFADTAAVLSQLDLLISVDTSTVHMAGAMGKPAWVLLEAVPDWRWRCPELSRRWYPTIQQFRQTAPREWNEAVADVAAALEDLAATSTAKATA